MRKEDFIYDDEMVHIGNVSLCLFDEKPVRVTNPYSGESCMLEPEAVAIYDAIKGIEILGYVQSGLSEEEEDRFHFLVETFSQNWPEEYMTLLD